LGIDNLEGLLKYLAQGNQMLAHQLDSVHRANMRGSLVERLSIRGMKGFINQKSIGV
jgi:hypothetical protein